MNLKLFLKTAVLIICINIFIGCQSGNKKQLSIEKKIHSIENNLAVNNSDNNNGTQLSTSIQERMDYYNVPGLSIAVINDFKIEWAKAYGVLNLETNSKVTENSFFEAASVTKMLVATLALHFVDKGLLELDKDVNDFLSSWEIPENEFTKNKKVTLRHLLSHTSGLPATNFPYEKGKSPILIQVLNGESPARNKPAVVKAIPGTKWEYSNIGYVVIQQILEDITGRPLQKVIKEFIFEPLQMKNSTLEYPLTEEKHKYEALPHDAYGIVYEPYMHPSALAQGGLITTPSDLAKLIIELMKAYNGKSDLILSQKSAKTMINKEWSISAEKSFNNNLLPNSMGLGVFIRGKDESFIFDHFGFNNPGLSCLASGNPFQGNGIVIMANGANWFKLYQEIIEVVANVYDWQINPYAQTNNSEMEKYPVSLKLKKLIDEFGIEEASGKYYELKKNYPEIYNFTEDQLNGLGYHYLKIREYNKAIAVFKINTEVFPESANVYDSLGEAYLKNGDTEKAIENYEKSLELDPNNQNAKDILKNLRK